MNSTPFVFNAEFHSYKERIKNGIKYTIIFSLIFFVLLYLLVQSINVIVIPILMFIVYASEEVRWNRSFITRLVIGDTKIEITYLDKEIQRTEVFSTESVEIK